MEFNTINTIINGYQLNLSLFQYKNRQDKNQNGLRIIIKVKDTGKQYLGFQKYQEQNQIFQFIFYNMNETLNYIKNSLKNQDGMIKISPTGKLQIQTKVNNKIQLLTLETQQIQIEEAGIGLQMSTFIKNDITNLQELVKGLKKQIDQLKKQMKNKIDKNENYGDRILSFKQAFQFEMKQSEIKTVEAMNNFKRKIEQNTQRIQKACNDKVQALKREMLQINSKLKELGQYSQVQSAKQTDLFDHKEIFDKKLIQCNGQIESLWESMIFRLGHKLKRIKLTVNTQTKNFNQECFRMTNNKIFERYKDTYYRQAVSNQELPSTGKYFFQVNCHRSNDSQTFIGILTQNCLQNKYSYDNKQSISYFCTNGYLFQNGSCSIQIGRQLNNQKGLISVLVDMDSKQIHWSIDHQYQGKAKISKNLLNKKLFAFIENSRQGSLHEFIS